MGIAGKNDYEEYTNCINDNMVECNYEAKDINENNKRGNKMEEKKDMREFKTGATRNIDANKLDYEGFISPVVEHRYAQYMHKHRKQKDGTIRDSDNWQKGIPVQAYKKSLVRHTIDLWALLRGEVPINPDNNEPCDLQDLLCAIKFNVNGLLFEILKAEKDGIDFKELERKQRENT